MMRARRFRRSMHAAIRLDDVKGRLAFAAELHKAANTLWATTVPVLNGVATPEQWEDAINASRAYRNLAVK